MVTMATDISHNINENDTIISNCSKYNFQGNYKFRTDSKKKNKQYYRSSEMSHGWEGSWTVNVLLTEGAE